MNGFIKNNKEILITLFCIWIGIIFTLVFIKLSSIEEKLSSIDEIESEIDSAHLSDISFHLLDISGELRAISSQLEIDALSRTFGQ